MRVDPAEQVGKQRLLRISAPVWSLPAVVGWGSRKGGERQGLREGWQEAALGWHLGLEVGSAALKGMLPNMHCSGGGLLIFVSTKILRSSSHIYPRWRGQEDRFLFFPLVRTQSVPGPSMLEVWVPQIRRSERAPGWEGKRENPGKRDTPASSV